jgi:hypothetical protein
MKGISDPVEKQKSENSAKHSVDGPPDFDMNYYKTNKNQNQDFSAAPESSPGRDRGRYSDQVPDDPSGCMNGISRKQKTLDLLLGDD